MIIRKYPFGFHDEQEAGIIRLKKLTVNVKVEGGDLVKQINDSDLVIYGSTSAGFESLLCGRLSVCLDIHHVIKLDCVTGKGDTSKVFVASNVKELREIVTLVKEMNLEEYKEKAVEMREFAKKVYSPVSRELVQKILKGIYSSSSF